MLDWGAEIPGFPACASPRLYMPSTGVEEGWDRTLPRKVRRMYADVRLGSSSRRGTGHGGQAEPLRCQGLLQLAPQQRLGAGEEVRLCLVAPRSPAR